MADNFCVFFISVNHTEENSCGLRTLSMEIVRPFHCPRNEWKRRKRSIKRFDKKGRLKAQPIGNLSFG